MAGYNWNTGLRLIVTILIRVSKFESLRAQKQNNVIRVQKRRSVNRAFSAGCFPPTAWLLHSNARFPRFFASSTSIRKPVLSPSPLLSLSLCLYFRGHSFGNYRCRSGTRLNAKENFTRANSSPRSRPVPETRANDARSVTRARFQEKMVGLGGCASNLFVFGKRFRSRQTETRIPRESTPVFLYRPWYYQRRSFANTLFDTPLSDRACSVPYFDTQGDVYAYRPSSTSEKHRYTADVRCWTLDVQRASLST